jgi:hypothetical protein
MERPDEPGIPKAKGSGHPAPIFWIRFSTTPTKQTGNSCSILRRSINHCWVSPADHRRVFAAIALLVSVHSAGRPEYLAVYIDFNKEGVVMFGPFSSPVCRKELYASVFACTPAAGFIVTMIIIVEHRPDLLFEIPHDKRFGSFKTAVQIARGEQGFHAVGEQGFLVPSSGILLTLPIRSTCRHEAPCNHRKTVLTDYNAFDFEKSPSALQEDSKKPIGDHIPSTLSPRNSSRLLLSTISEVSLA